MVWDDGDPGAETGDVDECGVVMGNDLLRADGCIACRSVRIRHQHYRVAQGQGCLTRPMCERIDVRDRTGAVVRGVGAFAQALLDINDEDGGVHAQFLFRSRPTEARYSA